MRKVLAFVIVAAFMLGTANPAGAIWKGMVCKDFPGPDGAGGVHLEACLVVDDHDFEPQIRPLVFLDNEGTQRADVHLSYLQLLKTGVGVVRECGPLTWSVYPDISVAKVCNYVNNPHGQYHSRIRMWVCWPFLPGDPCGSVVVWNSGDANYI